LKALVVGYGSIGARHARLLTELDCSTAVLSRRSINFPIVFSDIDQALNEHQPDYVVISNPTSLHHQILRQLAENDYRGRVLVEKPLFNALQPIPNNNFYSISVAYNLRFHPVIKRLRVLLAGEKVLSVQAYVGQYLPDWRPGVDYRDTYSAKVEQGGGALRDLSHELDYLAWLFGPWSSVAALGGHFSDLEIDSDDLYILLMQTTHCPGVTVQLNYLDRVEKRRMIINTERLSMDVDFVAGTLNVNGEIEYYSVERDETYLSMHRAVLNDSTDTICSLEEGLTTMRLIEAAEQASRQKKWVRR
jgi:predicted dehydrogenase